MAAATAASTPVSAIAVTVVKKCANAYQSWVIDTATSTILCHPFLVHAASWPHRGRSPRIIAQPGVTLYGQYALRAEPGETPPPVQQAILDSLAATR